jgi:hypothetical protein
MTSCPQCRALFDANSVTRNRKVEEIIEKLKSIGV